MLDILWAEWRNTYLKALSAAPAGLESRSGEPDACLFCRLPTEPLAVAHVLEVSEHAFSALNRYPYTSGHVMVAPLRHTAEMADLGEAEVADVWRLLTRAQGALRSAMAPDGFNLGANLGRAAGAGVPGHLHVHLVPRWIGDTNVMSVTAGARVMPQSLDDTWAELHGLLETT